MTEPTTKRLKTFSGVKPSGGLHLGNYLGAIKRWVDDQYVYENVFCIVDLHAITVPQDPVALRQQTREVAAFYIAAGLDPARTIVFVQGHVSAHAELGWVLNCITPMGWLERMTQFKDKAAREGDNRERISTGLFDYPVLMASDILLYDANLVPVGDDQKQHVELTRDIAERVNRLYGDILVVPKPLIAETGARIMGLADPSKKMSKSDNLPGQAIGIFDKPEDIRKAIMRATTDSERTIVFDTNRPGLYNLLTIYQVLSGETREQIETRFEGKGYGDLKRTLADAVLDTLSPIQARCNSLLNSSDLDDLLRDGADRARVIADRTFNRVCTAMGLR
jgi:tryptophanyl-tRNA synthetase